MSNEKFEQSKNDGPHFRLSQAAGTWEGITRVWFEPEKTEDESPMQGTIRAALDGRFLVHEYKGSFKGNPLEGIAIYGYHLAGEKYQCAWVDSFHMGTGIMFSQSETNYPVFSVVGKYGDEKGGLAWGWRTELAMTSADELVITAYNITPDGKEIKAVETVYKRKS